MVARSDDGGEHWRWLSQIGEDATVVSLRATYQFSGRLVLFALTESGGGPGDAGYGRRHQMLWRSTDGGHTWQCWLEGLADDRVSLLTWDGPASEPNALIALGRSVHIPRSDAQERRGGRVRPLWQAVELGPGVSRITSLATPPGPLAGRTVFVGTNAGVFVSRDGGRSYGLWGVRSDDGTAPVDVLSVAVAPDYATSGEVFVVASGGEVWRRIDR
jgi:hypothetical protein